MRIMRIEYIKLQLSESFWEMVKGDWVIVFHFDSMICRNSPKKPEDFFEWDFVGAPWRNHPVGGNSGFSLRNKAAMVRLLKVKRSSALAHIANSAVGEDVWTGENGPLTGMRMATKEIEKQWSVENLFYPSPLGVHAPYIDVGRQGANWTVLLRYCPDIALVTPFYALPKTNWRF